jgi:hypothetical protein
MPIKRNATSPDRIAIIERQAQALEMRKAGQTFEHIAQAIGYTNGGGAYKAVERALKATLQEPADELRRLECERLDAMLRALWPSAISGKWLAVDRCLAIMDRRAKLLGLDAPIRTRIDVITNDAFSEAMASLEAELADLEKMGDRSSRS